MRFTSSDNGASMRSCSLATCWNCAMIVVFTGVVVFTMVFTDICLCLLRLAKPQYYLSLCPCNGRLAHRSACRPQLTGVRHERLPAKPTLAYIMPPQSFSPSKRSHVRSSRFPEAAGCRDECRGTHCRSRRTDRPGRHPGDRTGGVEALRGTAARRQRGEWAHLRVAPPAGRLHHRAPDEVDIWAR